MSTARAATRMKLATPLEQLFGLDRSVAYVVTQKRTAFAGNCTCELSATAKIQRRLL